MSFYTDPKTPSHVRKVLNDIKNLSDSFASQVDIEILEQELADLAGTSAVGAVTVYAGEDIDAGEMVYVDDQGFAWLAAADNPSTTDSIGMAAENIMPLGEPGRVIISGAAAYPAGDLTPGGLYFLSDSVAGALQPAAPTQEGSAVIIVGRALRSDLIIISLNLKVVL